MLSKPPSQTLDALFKGAFILAIFALGLITGAAALYYNWPGSRPVKQAFEAGKVWMAPTGKGKPRLTSIESYLPRFKVTWDEKHAYNGYTLITLRFEDVYLVDMRGKVVRHWHLPFTGAWPDPQHAPRWNRRHIHIHIERARLLPNGDLIVTYTGPEDTPYGYGMAKYNKDGNLLWTYDVNAHHDFYIDSQGAIYTLVQKFRHEPWPGLEHIYYPQMADYIVKLSPEGKELERVSLFDAFLDSSYAKMIKNKTKPAWPKSKWERLHTNSVMKLESPLTAAFPMFREGQVLISLRNMNAIAVVDMAGKKVVWAQRGPWLGQHAAHFLKDGTILMFDNRGLETLKGRVSRAIAFDPKTSKVTWEFNGAKQRTIDSVIYGRVEPLGNGNVLIIESLRRKIWEVTPDKKVVWEYEYPRFSKWATVVSAVRYRPEELPFLTER